MEFDCFKIEDLSQNGRKDALKSKLNTDKICKRVVAENFEPKGWHDRDLDQMYVACELIDKQDGKVTALVAIGYKDGGDYCIKTMTEKRAPEFFRPSEDVLNALSEPAPNEHAENWRQESRRLLKRDKTNAYYYAMTR